MLRVGVWGVGTWGEKHARIWRALSGRGIELEKPAEAVERVNPVASLSTVTVAPTSTAPDLSVIVVSIMRPDRASRSRIRLSGSTPFVALSALP